MDFVAPPLLGYAGGAGLLEYTGAGAETGHGTSHDPFMMSSSDEDEVNPESPRVASPVSAASAAASATSPVSAASAAASWSSSTTPVRGVSTSVVLGGGAARMEKRALREKAAWAAYSAFSVFASDAMWWRLSDTCTCCASTAEHHSASHSISGGPARTMLLNPEPPLPLQQGWDPPRHGWRCLWLFIKQQRRGEGLGASSSKPTQPAGEAVTRMTDEA